MKLRDRVLAAAAVAFTELGYDGAEIRQIAKVSRASIGSIFFHFGSKHGLYEAAMGAPIPKPIDFIRSIAQIRVDNDQQAAAAFCLLRDQARCLLIKMLGEIEGAI